MAVPMSACGVLHVPTMRILVRRILKDKDRGFGLRRFRAAGHSVDRGDEHEQGEERRQKRRHQSLPDRGETHAAP